MIARIGIDHAYCNTETATPIVTWTTGSKEEKTFAKHTLYVNTRGKFFIFVDAMEKSPYVRRRYGHPVAGEAIFDTNEIEVENIIDKHFNKADAYTIKAQYLWPNPRPKSDEGDSPKSVSVRLSPAAYRLLKGLSKSENMSLSKYIEHLILEKEMPAKDK